MAGHRKGGRLGADLKKKPGLRHEICHAGLQQTRCHHGSAQGGEGGDSDFGGGREPTQIPHQPSRSFGHVCRGEFAVAVVLYFGVSVMLMT